MLLRLPELLLHLYPGLSLLRQLLRQLRQVTQCRPRGALGLSSILITSTFYYVYRVAPKLLVARGACPAGDADACRHATRWSRVMLWASSVLLVAGFSVAYLLPVLLERLDS
jgi:hypothetical protein